MTLNSQSSCLQLLHSKIIGAHHLIKLGQFIFIWVLVLASWLWVPRLLPRP